MTGRPTELGRSFFPQMLTADGHAKNIYSGFTEKRLICAGVFGLRTIFVRTGIIGVSMELTYLSEIK